MSRIEENPFLQIIENGLPNSVAKWHHYLPLYHRHFRKYQENASSNNKVIILEIGVCLGGSLDMWNKYFGKENCEIYGIDIDDTCKRFDTSNNGGNIHILIGDQEDIEFLQKVKRWVPSPDIIIDDGGHYAKQQINTFDQLFTHLKMGGMYLCEDTHTSYWPSYGGGLNTGYSFIQHTKAIIDHLNAYHHRIGIDTVNHLTRTCYGVHVYDSMVFFEKSIKELGRPTSQIWPPSSNCSTVSTVSSESAGSNTFTGLKITSSTNATIKAKTTVEKNLYIDLLKKCVSDYIYCSNIAGQNKKISDYDIENGTTWPDRAHSMIGLKRLNNIQFCVEDILKNGIEGDLIETGVWRGGSTIFMKGILKVHEDNKRKVFVADSFEGLPPPDPKYPADAGDAHYQNKFLAVSKEQVQANFNRYDLLDENVVFLKGFFEHSLPNAPIDKLSILRLDGDMYSSTIQVLEILYDKLSIGGYLIIDDYGLGGCEKAITDFRVKRNITEEMIIVDWTGRYWQKLRA